MWKLYLNNKKVQNFNFFLWIKVILTMLWKKQSSFRIWNLKKHILIYRSTLLIYFFMSIFILEINFEKLLLNMQSSKLMSYFQYSWIYNRNINSEGCVRIIYRQAMWPKSALWHEAILVLINIVLLFYRKISPEESAAGHLLIHTLHEHNQHFRYKSYTSFDISIFELIKMFVL